MNARAQALDTATQQRVRAATFEVVMLKPVDDPVTYEKPLPMELLPYQFRTDAYFSVGTAFSIGDHRFVTAAHVLGLGIASAWGAPALRDSSGKIYAIDKVLKYSTSQDFAVFSLVKEPDVAPLATSTHAAINDPVYAVGNALGEGVVIRDGVYTSDTPEERDGRWNWLRFSAAASPGNSGGPLLDNGGAVVGIILRKSPNENLNYALKIDDLLKAKDNSAQIDLRETYQLDLFDFKQTEAFTHQFDLPLNYADFSERFRNAVYPFDDRLLQDLLSRHHDDIFPQGEGSTDLLHTIQYGSPGLIMRGEDGKWSVSRPSSERHADLANNGSVSLGRLARVLVAEIRRSDDVPAATFYQDSKLFMDQVLKALPMSRNVGPENVRMISLGKARQDSVFSDSYGRKWQLREWAIPYLDAVAVSVSLPVPEGYVVLMRTVSTGQLHENINDLKAMADFAAVTYHGTLAQWLAFLKSTALLPAAFSDLELTIDYGKSLRYRSPRGSFGFAPELQKITPNSELALDFSYFVDHGRTIWDVARIRAGEDAHNKTAVIIARHIEPARSMDDHSKNIWAKMASGSHPYDAVMISDGDLSSIHGIKPPAAKASGDQTGVLYSVLVQVDGAATQESMKTRLDLALQGLTMKDDLAPLPAATGSGDENAE